MGESLMRLSTSVLCLAFLCGCTDIWGAHSKSIHRTDEIGDDTIIFTDAKQSATFARFDGARLRACAARSPDAFSVLSAAAEGSASAEQAGKLAATLSGRFASGETGAAFGLRTQLTQTQLELLYRLCEADLNGALQPGDYEKHMRRFQNTMVAMLAVEQLTGYARPTVTTISSDAGFAPPANAADIQARIKVLQGQEDEQAKVIDAAKNDVAAKVTALQAAEAASAAADKDPAATPEAKKEKKDAVVLAKNNLSDSEAKLRTAEDRLFSLRQDRQKLERSLATGAPVSGGGFAVAMPDAPDPIAQQSVAAAVNNIVNEALHQTETTEECLKYVFLQSKPSSNDNADVRLQFCVAHLNNVTEQKWDALYLGYGCRRIPVSLPMIPGQPFYRGMGAVWQCPERANAPGPLVLDSGQTGSTPVVKNDPTIKSN